MKRHRVEIFHDGRKESYNTTVEADNKRDAVIKVMDELAKKQDERFQWPMKAIEL
jgi:hypothetical protein